MRCVSRGCSGVKIQEGVEMMWEGDDEAESDLRMCIPTGPLGSPMSYTRVMGGEGCGLSGEERGDAYLLLYL